MWTTVEQTTAPNRKTPIESADNENNINDDQQDLPPTPNMDAENSPNNTDESQVTTLSEDVVEIQREKLPTNKRDEKYNLRPNPNCKFSYSFRY